MKNSEKNMDIPGKIVLAYRNKHTGDVYVQYPHRFWLWYTAATPTKKTVYGCPLGIWQLRGVDTEDYEAIDLWFEKHLHPHLLKAIRDDMWERVSKLNFLRDIVNTGVTYNNAKEAADAIWRKGTVEDAVQYLKARGKNW